MKDQTRNLYPHAEAQLHAWVWGQFYSEQNGGVMDFWDIVSESRKKEVREMMEQLSKLPRE